MEHLTECLTFLITAGISAIVRYFEKKRMLKDLKESIGMQGSLSAYGVRPEHMARLVAIATADTCHQTNPRPCSAADFEILFKAAM